MVIEKLYHCHIKLYGCPMLYIECSKICIYTLQIITKAIVIKIHLIFKIELSAGIVCIYTLQH